MNTKNVSRSLYIAVFCLSLAVSCAPKSRTTEVHHHHGGAPVENNGGGPKEDQGTSSGGGGFVGENSTKILKVAATGLADFIRDSSPIIYRNLPKGWTQERLATVIENVRYLPLTERAREGDSLMFDYGTDAKGQYIVALKPFFLAYSSFPINFAEPSAVGSLYHDVRIKLAHEVSHLMGLNEELAKVFSQRLMKALYTDSISCSMEDSTEIFNERSKVPGSPISKTSIFVNRPTGISSLINITYSPSLNNYHTAYSGPMNPEEYKKKMDKEAKRALNCIIDNPVASSTFHSYKLTGAPVEICSDRGPSDLVDYHSEPVAAGAVLQFKFVSKVYSPAGTHLLEVELPKGEDQVSKGSFTRLEKGSPAKVSAECRFNAKPMLFPNPGDRVEKPTKVQPSNDSRPPSQGLGPEHPYNVLKAAEPQIQNQISSLLQDDLKQIYPFEVRGGRGEVQTCYGKDNIKKLSLFGLTAAAVIELKDGRVCAMGLSVLYENRDSFPIRSVDLVANNIGIPGDGRNFRNHVECFRGNQSVSSEDIRAKLPAKLIGKGAAHSVCEDIP
jgi:hypothetical protein